MTFTTWRQWWKQSRKASEEQREPVRRLRGRFRPLGLEVLEDRTLLSGNPFSAISTDLDSRLTTLQGQLSNVLDTTPALSSLPFVGQSLGKLDAAKFVDQLRTPIHTALTNLANTVLPSDATIRNTLFSVLGSGPDAPNGLNLIGDTNNDGSVGADDVVVTHPAALGASGLVIEMRLHRDLVTATTPLTFSTGLPSLPFSVSTSGTVAVRVGFDYELAFQYNSDLGQTTFDTSALLDHFGGGPANLANPHHELAVTVDATLPQGFVATATVGFLQGSIKDIGTPGSTDPAQHTEFRGTFNLDGLDNLSSASLDGRADVNLRLSGGFGSNADFPSVGADFQLHWAFDSSNPAANPPSVRFDNVNLDLGQFLSGMLEPILRGIQQGTAPIKPLLDVITAPLPGISDISHFIGQGDVTLLGLASVAAGQTGYGPLAALVTTIVNLIQDVDAIHIGQGTILIPLGGFNLDRDANGQPYDLRAAAAGDVNNLGLVNLTNLVANDPSQIDLSQVINNPQVPQAVKDVLNQLTQPNGIKFAFPILDHPASAVFGMLLGRDSDLVSFSADVHFASDGGQAGGLSVAGVGVTFGGEAKIDGHFRFAYDTFGLRELIRDIGNHTGNVLTDITDGFYVDTGSYFKIAGLIGAGPDVSFGIVDIGLLGAITTGNNGDDPIGVGIKPQPGNKLRFSGFTLSNISTFGELDASLLVRVRIGVTIAGHFIGLSHTFGIASVTLLNLNIDPNKPPPVPALASGPDDAGEVTLYVGQKAALRRVYDFFGKPIPGDSQDGNENYAITHVGDDPSGETIDVTAFGITQTIHGVKSIRADGDLGDLTVNVRHGVEADVDLTGGVGHANLTYSGSGDANLNAGNLASTLIGGSGSNRFDGGPGGDTLVAGSGANFFLGGPGDNTIVIQAPNANVTLINGGDPSANNTLEVLEPSGSKAITVSPAAGSAFNLVVQDADLKPLLSLVVGNVTNLILGTGGVNNTLTVGDLSRTSLQRLVVDAGRDLGFSGHNAFTFHGSPGADTFSVSTALDPATGERPLYVAVSAPGGKTLTTQIHGGSLHESLVLDGGGGGDNYSVFEDPYLLLPVAVQDSGPPSSDNLRVFGTGLSRGSESVTDSAVVFHYTVPFGTLQIPATAQVNFDGNVKFVEVHAPDGGETITANRSAGSTGLYGGSGDDRFDVSGQSIYTLYGLDGVNTYVVHMATLGGGTTIYGNSLFGADTLLIDDKTNGSSVNTTYSVSSNNVTRVAQDAFLFEGGVVLTASFTASVTFSPMHTVTVDTGLGTEGANYINVASTRAGTTTTLNATDGVNTFSLSPVEQNLDGIAGRLVLRGGSGVNLLGVNDRVGISRLFNGIFVSPGEILRESLFIDPANPFFPPQFQFASIGFAGINDLTVLAPLSYLSVDLDTRNIPFNTASLGRAGTERNLNFYQIASQQLPLITFFNDLRALTINEQGVRTQVDVYDTPSGFSTGVVLGGTDTVTVHGTSGPLGIDGTGSVFLGNPLPRGGSLAAFYGVVTLGGQQGGAFTVGVDYGGDAGPHHGQLTGTLLSGVAPASIVLGTGIQSLTIHTGSSQGSDFTVLDTPAGAATFLDGGIGDDTFLVLATTGSLVVNPGAGNNTVHVGDATHNLGQIFGALSVDGLGGFTSLFLHDESTQDVTNDQFNGVDIETSTNQVTFTVTGGTVIRSNSIHSEIRPDPSLILKGSRVPPVIVRTLTSYELIGYHNLGALVINGGQSGSNLAALLVPIRGGGQPGNVFNVQGTAAGTATTIRAGTESDAVNVGDAANRLDAILGLLAVDGRAGYATLNVNDQGTTADKTYGVTAGAFTRASSSQPTVVTERIIYSAIGMLVVHGGNSGGNSFNVQSTATGTALTLNTGSGNDDVFVGSAGTVANIDGPVDVHGTASAGATSLFVLDGSDPVAKQNVILDDGSLTGLAPAAITWTPAPNAAASGGVVELSVTGGYGGNTYAVKNTSPFYHYTFLAAGAGVNKVNVRGTTGELIVQSDLGGHNDVTLGSQAVGAGSTLANLKGPVYIIDQTYTNLIVDDSGDGTARSARIDSQSIVGLAPTDIHYDAGVASLTISGGPSGNNSFNGSFAGNFAMSLGISGFATAALHVGGDFSGSFLAPTEGNITQPIQRIAVDGSVTAAATIKVNYLTSLSVGQNLAGTVKGFGSGSQDIATIGAVTVGGALTSTGSITAPILGTIAIQGNDAGSISESNPTQDMQLLSVGGALTGQVNAGSIGTLMVSQDLSGGVNVRGALGAATVTGSLTGTVAADSIGSLTVGKDLTGHVTAAHQLGAVMVGGNSGGSISAGQLTTLSGTNAHGPVLLDVWQAGIERQVLATPLPGYSLSAVSFTYTYDAVTGPHPRLTLHVVNTDPAHDRFDLSLVSSSSTGDFDLARLDATGTGGVHDITAEGDLLPASIQLPADHLGSVSTWGNAAAKAIAARSVEALAFGALVLPHRTIAAADAKADDAVKLLAPGTTLVRADGTFRVPFSNARPVALFLDLEGDDGLDDRRVLFTDQMLGQAPITALVTVSAPGRSWDDDHQAAIQTIALLGDGGSIRTDLPIFQGITSTGPLGDLILGSHRGVPDVTAPSIFGDVRATRGPIWGTVQTTGRRIDPLTGVTTPVAADFGRILTDQAGNVVGVTQIHAGDGGITGRIVSRGNLVSRVFSDDGISGLVAAQGNIAETNAVDADGNSVRLGGIVSNGPVTGQIVVLVAVFGDVTIGGGLRGGRIAARGGILGNMTIEGGLDAGATIVSDGAIGDAVAGTALTVHGTNKGLIAARGPIHFGEKTPRGAVYNNVGAIAGSPNAAAIDAIFTDNHQSLAFDSSGLDLAGLNLILADLLALKAGAGGNLTGPVA